MKRANLPSHIGVFVGGLNSKAKNSSFVCVRGAYFEVVLKSFEESWRFPVQNEVKRVPFAQRRERGLVRTVLFVAVFCPILIFAKMSNAAEPVEMDQLLTLPKGFGASAERRGGLTRIEWIDRFALAEQALAAAKEALAKSQRAMEEAASGEGWKAAPPGLPASTEGTANFQLRQEIKRNRGEVARAEKHLRDLIVEANLAEVPENWRHAEVSDSTSPTQASEAEIQP